MASAAMLDLFGMPMCVGSVSASEQETSAAVAIPVAEAQDFVKRQNVKGGDETSWFEGAKREKVWLWAAFTQWVAVFLIRPSRGTDVAKELLGKAFGVLITDRWCAYTWWPLRWRQLCWAHLKRHFQAFVDAGGKSARIGTALLQETKLLFEWWHRVRDGTLARSTFRRYVIPLRRRVGALLRKGAACGFGPTEATCRELLKLEPALWTFVRVEGVEPTNNCTERIIRPGVIWRKTCFGTHSEAGSRFVERMLTVTCTLRRQGRNVVDFVTRAVEASLQGKTPPSLLPFVSR
jgi:transposase